MRIALLDSCTTFKRRIVLDVRLSKLILFRVYLPKVLGSYTILYQLQHTLSNLK